MKIGYARVSTNDQNLDSQIALLTEDGCKEILKEKISGAKKSRPELEKLLGQIREGDTLVVCKLACLARSTSHLLEIVETLREKKAYFRSLGEPWADSTSHAGKMIMTVFAGIAEFERDLIRERTSVGREAAMKRGVISLLSLSEKAIATTLIHRKIYWFDLILDFLLGNKVAIAF